MERDYNQEINCDVCKCQYNCDGKKCRLMNVKITNNCSGCTCCASYVDKN